MQARGKQDCGQIPKEDTHVWKGGREVVVMVPPLDSMGSETLRPLRSQWSLDWGVWILVNR